VVYRASVGSEPNGSWAYRRSLPADRQIRVILIAHSPECIDVFAHGADNWLRYPSKHLRQVGSNRKAGRDKTRHWIESHGVDVDVNSCRRRQVTRAGKHRHKYLGSITR
jgi:hypothetical protein